MSSGIGEDVLYDATKYRSQPRKKWNISGGDNMISMDVSQGNHKGSEPSSPLSARSSSEPKSQNVLRNPIVPEPSTALLHPVGHKFPEIFQLQQGRYSDLPAAKISEMMKSNSLDNAPTQSLLSVVNGILDESIERKNGEIPHPIACLLRKVVQEIERRILTQADHIGSQNNLIKAREEKYQSRIRVLETLASGTSEETQIVSNQLQKIKVAGSPSESYSLRHSLSSPGLSLSSEHRDRLLTGGKMGRSTEKVASDPENSSEFSDKHSENGSQQSADDIGHRRENGYADSDERRSDISDGGHSMGAETDCSTSESSFSETSNKSETTKQKMARISSSMPKQSLPKKTGPTMSVRPKLRDPLKSPVLKKSASNQSIASSPRTSKR